MGKKAKCSCVIKMVEHVVESYDKSKHMFGNLHDIFQIDKKNKQNIFITLKNKSGFLKSISKEKRKGKKVILL